MNPETESDSSVLGPDLEPRQEKLPDLPNHTQEKGTRKKKKKKIKDPRSKSSGKILQPEDAFFAQVSNLNLLERKNERKREKWMRLNEKEKKQDRDGELFSLFIGRRRLRVHVTSGEGIIG